MSLESLDAAWIAYRSLGNSLRDGDGYKILADIHWLEFILERSKEAYNAEHPQEPESDHPQERPLLGYQSS